MSGEQEKSELVLCDARMLEGSATQTRFTWAVIFLALVTVLVGLLTMIEPYTSKNNPLFNDTIFSIYFGLNFGISYIFYAVCYTTFIIIKLTKEHERKSVRDFVSDYWSHSYDKLICTVKKKNEEEIVDLKRKTVIPLSISVGAVSLLPLLFKVGFGVVTSLFILFVTVAIEIIVVLISARDNYQKDTVSIS